MATIELLVEVKQAKEAVQSIDKRFENLDKSIDKVGDACLLYTSPSPRD